MKPWKIQKFFGDVVYDLRNRGLLPVVILLLIAMVAVPVLIARGSSGSSGSSVQPTADAGDVAPEGRAAVLAYNPGIRDYRKRLESLAPTDPFRQQFAESAAAASALNSTVAAPPDSGSTPTSSSISPSSGGSTTTTPESAGRRSGKKKSSKKKKSSRTTYTYSVTVMAGDASTELTPFPNVTSLMALPGQTTPVVVYYGLSSDNSQALFLVSNKVDSLTGPGTCLPAPDDCSLLGLTAGQSADLHYTQDGKTYRVAVSEIKRVAR